MNQRKKNITVSVFFLVVLFLILTVEIFSLRSYFFTPYDNNYVRDLYDHSQWSLARSTRTISDELIYQVASYDLVNTWKFFTINPEAPVLAKYLYGLSIKIFNNPIIAALIIFLLSIPLSYLILKQIIKNKNLVKIATLIYAMEPLVFSQASISMLDLPQLFVFLIHIYSILNIINLIKSQNKKSLFFYIFLTGFSLGCFVSIKIGFLSLVILLADFIILYKIKKYIFIVPIILITSLTYIISYLPFLLSGYSIIEFLKTQKWILNYWLFSASAPKRLYGVALVSLLSGLTKGWYEDAIWERINEWTILWPVYLATLVYMIIKIFQKNKINLHLQYLIYLLVGFMSFYIIVPFFTRYLLLSLPLFIIIFVYISPKINKSLLFILMIIFVTQFTLYLIPTSTEALKSIKEKWNNGAYQDLFSHFDNQSQKQFSRNEFWRKMQLFEKNIGVESRSININLPQYYFWQNKITANFQITYKTHLTTIRNNQLIFFHKENNLWKFNWNDNLILSDFSLNNDQVVSTFEMGKYGTLKSKDGTILSQEQEWPFFLIVPNKVKDEQNVQNQLILLTGLKKYQLELLYKANNQPDIPAEIGFLRQNINPDKFKNTKLDQAITVEQRKTRVYNWDLIKKGKFNSIISIESKYLPILNPILGGKTIIKKPNGENIILQMREKKDGADVVIN